MLQQTVHAHVPPHFLLSSCIAACSAGIHSTVQYVLYCSRACCSAAKTLLLWPVLEVLVAVMMISQKLSFPTQRLRVYCSVRTTVLAAVCAARCLLVCCACLCIQKNYTVHSSTGKLRPIPKDLVYWLIAGTHDVSLCCCLSPAGCSVPPAAERRASQDPSSPLGWNGWWASLTHSHSQIVTFTMTSRSVRSSKIPGSLFRVILIFVWNELALLIDIDIVTMQQYGIHRRKFVGGCACQFVCMHIDVSQVATAIGCWYTYVVATLNFKMSELNWPATVDEYFPVKLSCKHEILLYIDQRSSHTNNSV